MPDDVVETIRDTLFLRRRQLTERTPLRKLLRDSLDAVELIAVLSERYEIDVIAEELDGLETVGDVVRYVGKHRGNSGERATLDAF